MYYRHIYSSELLTKIIIEFTMGGKLRKMSIEKTFLTQNVCEKKDYDLLPECRRSKIQTKEAGILTYTLFGSAFPEKISSGNVLQIE